ncbi:MAG TPA: GDP-mannose 4,6-dehydratase [Dyella sp.]|uniref:GDP-mannose 4,6-dehydratase n=1 Tax=Dyella sp. TaxID=1869338 RepID=UPI002F95FC9F
MTQPSVLLTGAQGFTGKYMEAALVGAGYRVHGWGGDVSVVGASRESVDLTDRQSVYAAIDRLRPDLIVHLAAISFVAHGDAAAIYNVNVVGTRNLLEAVSRLDRLPQKILLASSANVYGVRPGAIDENAPFKPQNDYAVSKVAMEYMARVWSDRLPIVTVRPFNYTGVGQGENFLLPKIVGHFRRGEPVLELGNIDVCRDFYDVRHVVSLYMGLLEKAEAGDVFNVCSGQEISIREIIGFMERIAGRVIEVRTNPAFVRPNEVTHLRGDPSRIERLLGPLPDYSIRETLQWMFET